MAVLNLLFPVPSLTLLTCINSICSGSTLKAGGSRLSQREEDVTHDSGTADPGGGDNIEDAVYIMAKVFLWRGAEGRMCQIIEQPQNKQTRPSTHPLTLFVSKFSDSLSLTGSISQGLCSVQICEGLQSHLKFVGNVPKRV